MYIVAVHGGAGNHPSFDTNIKHALRLACVHAQSSVPDELSASETVGIAVSTLEDQECFNAGYGSNLTFDGQVECDAAVMEDEAGFGSVGAVSGIKNPIHLAHAILEHSRVPDPLGRIPPLTLVSHGANIFAKRRGICSCVPESLISPRSRNEWETWKARLKQSELLNASYQAMDAMQDTVGAVVWDSQDRLAAGVSSGGILLKHPGRIGEAAVFGAGCWAQSKSRRGVACSVSGTGEQIIRSLLAQAIADALFATSSQDDEFDTHSVLERLLTDRLVENCGSSEPQAGVLLLTKEPSQETPDGYTARLWCAFTTASMAIAYASSYDPKPKALILRRPSRQPSDGSPSLFITSLPLFKI